MFHIKVNCVDFKTQHEIGMLGTRKTVEAVASSLRSATGIPVVLDPVLASSSGAELLDAPGRGAMRKLLFPITTILIPNIPEAALIAGTDEARTDGEMRDQAEVIRGHGPKAVLIKGGHGRMRTWAPPCG